MTAIKIENISKAYGIGRNQTKVLNNISLQIKEGELFFLLGPSGCGKTTLLRIIAGLLTADSGQIFFNNKDITLLEPEKRNTAMVFQNYALWPHMTVFKNVEFGLKNKGVARSERKTMVAEKLRLVRMQDYAYRKPTQLSGGQQQRVALARALTAEPACLLFDEPLSNLDAQLRIQMRNEIRQLVKSSGTTGIYVTHDQKEALSMADRIAVMNTGIIEQIGTVDEIYYQPKNIWTAEFIGEANFINGHIVDIADHIAINCGSFNLIATKQGNFKIGETITCCIRPESLSFEDTPENSIPCRCVLSNFYGEVCQYLFEMENSSKLKMTSLSGRNLKTASSQYAKLSVKPENICLLKN